jgi:hypothetical protein
LTTDEPTLLAKNFREQRRFESNRESAKPLSEDEPENMPGARGPLIKHDASQRSTECEVCVLVMAL